MITSLQVILVNMKKAELSMQVLVITILAVIVLVVVIFIFRSQIGKIFDSFSRLVEANTGG